MKPATKVLFPGIALGWIMAAKEMSMTSSRILIVLTFVEVRSHALVVATDEGVVLRNVNKAFFRDVHRTRTSYRLVPCTAKKLKNPRAFPLASSNRSSVRSLSWSY